MTESKWPKYKNLYIGDNDCHYDSPKEYFWSEVLGFCGCYNHSLFNMAWDLLCEMYHSESGQNDYKYKDVTEENKMLQEIFLHIFAQKKLTDHGTSVRYSWLTDSGKELAKRLISDYERGPQE